MKSSKVRALVAAGALGAIALTGLFAANAAGALGNGTQSQRSGPLAGITAEQKSCLANQGITRPQGRPTAEQRQAIIAAATNCDITLPVGRGGLAQRAAQLTQEQRDCLTSNGVAKPDHRLNAEERAAFKTQLKAAAETCGIQRTPAN